MTVKRYIATNSFEVHFKECILDFSKFYTLKMKGTTFTDSSLVAVDFMSTN
jgi:hypothetical protein